MSRSYRKTPILKDGGRSSKYNKQLANRHIRRKANRDVYSDHIGSNSFYKKMYESWEINDYISRYTLTEAIEDYNRLIKMEWFYERYPTLEDWIKQYEKDYLYK